MDNAQTGNRSLAEAQAVIAAGHPPIADKLILIDFDGTIAPFGFLFDYPEPFTGVAHFTQMLYAKGFRVGIFTSRLSPTWLETVNQTAEQHVDYITKYCNQNEIKFDFITAEKVPSQAYIDDKAFRFEGSWIDMIREFVTRGWV